MVEKQNRALIAGFMAAVFCILVFGFLASQVARHATIQFDATVRDAIHSVAGPRLTYAMRGITHLGEPTVIVSVAVLLLWVLVRQKRTHAATLLVIAVIGAVSLDEILKLVFRRARPEAFFNYPEPITYSFPSGHSVAACCFYGSVAAIFTVRMKSRRRRVATWAIAGTIALLVGISRIYLGVHYPTDVVAGYATAVVWVSTVRIGYELWLKRRAGRNGAEV